MSLISKSVTIAEIGNWNHIYLMVNLILQCSLCSILKQLLICLKIKVWTWKHSLNWKRLKLRYTTFAKWNNLTFIRDFCIKILVLRLIKTVYFVDMWHIKRSLNIRWHKMSISKKRSVDLNKRYHCDMTSSTLRMKLKRTNTTRVFLCMLLMLVQGRLLCTSDFHDLYQRKYFKVREGPIFVSQMTNKI